MKFLGISGSLFLVRRMAALAPFCSMITDREIGLLVLVICVVGGLAPSVSFRGYCTRFAAIGLAPEVTSVRHALFNDPTRPCPFPFLTVLALRAPPSIS